MDKGIEEFLLAINTGFTVLFALEVILKILAWGGARIFRRWMESIRFFYHIARHFSHPSS